MRKLIGVLLAICTLFLWTRSFSRTPPIVFTISVPACAKPVSGISLPELAELLKKRGKKVSSVDSASGCVLIDHVIEKRIIDGAREGTEGP